MKRSDVIEFLQDCYNEMGFKDQGLGFDPDSVCKSVERFTEAGGFLKSVTEDGKIIAMAAALIAPNIMDHSELRAVEYIWHTHPSLPTRKRVEHMQSLLESMKEWARDRGLFLVLDVSASKPGAGKIAKRAGFREIGATLIKEPSWA